MTQNNPPEDNPPVAQPAAVIPPPVNPNDQLAQALIALTGILAAMQNQQQQQQQQGHGKAPVLDPFDSPDAFDISSRAGSYAYTTASLALDVKWDGSTSAFPPFLVALRIRASKARWDAPAPTGGVLSYPVGTLMMDVLDHYRSIPKPVIDNARANQTNSRAEQNSKAMYLCLQASITGDLKATVFGQSGNIPLFEDPLLLKRLMSFTMTSSLQLSIQG
jgi:hypothetical protein